MAERLKDEHCVFNISFEGLGDNSFSCVENACAEFLKILKRSSRVNGASGAMQALLKEVAPVGSKEMNPTDFMDIIDELCGLSPKPLVVLIDEVDQASNNEGFVGFLGVLRNADLLKEENTLFDDMQKKLMQFPKLEDSLRNIIYGGERVAYNFYDKEMNIAAMFNFIKEENGAAKIACRIFETWLYDYCISKDKSSSIYQTGQLERSQFIHDGCNKRTGLNEVMVGDRKPIEAIV